MRPGPALSLGRGRGVAAAALQAILCLVLTRGLKRGAEDWVSLTCQPPTQAPIGFYLLKREEILGANLKRRGGGGKGSLSKVREKDEAGISNTCL